MAKAPATCSGSPLWDAQQRASSASVRPSDERKRLKRLHGRPVEGRDIGVPRGRDGVAIGVDDRHVYPMCRFQETVSGTHHTGSHYGVPPKWASKGFVSEQRSPILVPSE